MSEQVQNKAGSVPATEGNTPVVANSDGSNAVTTAVATNDAGVEKLLQDAFKSVTDKIKQCDKDIASFREQITAKEKEKKELQFQMRTTLERYIGKKPRKPRTPKEGAGPREGTTRALILEFLESTGKATTSELKTYLEDKGKGNPGVELSRMVKDGVITHAGRGQYAKVGK